MDVPIGSRRRFLSVHGVDPRKWAERHGITPFAAKCTVCGRELVTTVPIAFKSWRGLAAPKCECGNEDTPYCVTL